jgi:hypothetical protein
MCALCAHKNDEACRKRAIDLTKARAIDLRHNADAKRLFDARRLFEVRSVKK